MVKKERDRGNASEKAMCQIKWGIMAARVCSDECHIQDAMALWWGSVVIVIVFSESNSSLSLNFVPGSSSLDCLL